MIETPTQTQSPERLSDTESTQLAAISGAVDRPISLWRSQKRELGDAADCWLPVSHPAESAQVVPADMLTLAAASEGPVCRESEPGRSLIAFRLKSGGGVGVVEASAEEAPLVSRLIGRVVSETRLAKLAEELQEENDAFASQLASDLEELTFLRAMVDQLSSSRVDDESIDLARSTLPVLNSTVRARCLAYLTTSDPLDPFQVELDLVVGEQQFPAKVFSDIIRQLGPMAEWRPFVKNWEATDLPTEAARCDGSVAFDGVSSLVIAPMFIGDKRYGWLLALNRTPSSEIGLESSWQLASNEFGSGEASLMATTAAILAAHAGNIDLLREKEKLMVSMIRSLVSAIEAKDNYTRGHSERVALFTKRLAEQMGYDSLELEQVYLTALLHDVGKIGVSDAVLKKEGKLTAEEYAEIAKHPDAGWAILGDLEHLQYVLPGVLHHHERWDGRGYPDGLAGESIPLDGRVMAVADAYDAMTSDRPYRKGMPVEKAEAILREGSGAQWDPKCVDAFFECLEDIHHIKATYRQRPHPVRVPGTDHPAAVELVHEVEGVTEG